MKLRVKIDEVSNFLLTAALIRPMTFELKLLQVAFLKGLNPAGRGVSYQNNDKEIINMSLNLTLISVQRDSLVEPKIITSFLKYTHRWLSTCTKKVQGYGI